MECVAGSVSKKRKAAPLDLFKYKHFMTIIIFSPRRQSGPVEEEDSNSVR